MENMFQALKMSIYFSNQKNTIIGFETLRIVNIKNYSKVFYEPAIKNYEHFQVFWKSADS